MIDLRSDTVTKPTPEMLKAMWSADVGDDVFQEDKEILLLQEEVATHFGHEAGLFCPSGTMTNQVAIRVHTRPGDEVICADVAHVYLYEGGGIARNAGASVRLISGDRGRLNENDVRNAIQGDDDHLAVSRMVCLEDTVNKGGGCYYDLNEIKKIQSVCKENGLVLHLDGARVFNALVETGYDAQAFGKCFDSISICFSKGLGAPVGSVLVGSKAFIKEARRVRKSMGGGMRQAGYLAAACRYALVNNVDRLKEDHKRAREIGKHLENSKYVKTVVPVETNIVIIELADGLSATTYEDMAAKLGVLCVPFGPDKIRFVTHLDFDDVQLAHFKTLYL
ncbi:MAG: threonine aldolase [Flavobacteriales bacterium]|jgi:threonine aldolase